MHGRLTILLTFLLVLVLPVLSKGGADTSNLIHYTLNNGLPTNNVYSVVQDKTGFLWFATDNGAVKFNGYTFDVYNTERGLPHNDIYELFVDNRNRIWIHSFIYEFGYLKNGKYRKLNYSSPIKTMSSSAYLATYGGLTYFTEAQNGLYNVVVVDDDLLKVLTIPSIVNRGKDTTIFVNLTLANNLKIQLWEWNNGLYSFRPGNDSFERQCNLPEHFRYLGLNSRLGISPEGTIYGFAMNGTSIDYFNPNICAYKLVKLVDVGAGPEEAIYALNPYYVNGRKDKAVLVITNKATYYFTHDLNLLGKTLHGEMTPSPAQIAFQFEDKDGNEWLTTNNDGVWGVPKEPNSFKLSSLNKELGEGTYLGAVANRLFWWNGRSNSLLEVTRGVVTAELVFPQGIALKSISGNDSVAYIASSQSLYKMNMHTHHMVDVDSIYQVEADVFGSMYQDRRTASISLRQWRSVALLDGVLYGCASHGVYECRWGPEGTFKIKRIDKERYTDILYSKRDQLVYAYSNKRILIKKRDEDTYRVLDDEYLKRRGISLIKKIDKDSFGNLVILDDNDIFVYDEVSGKVKTLSKSFLVSEANMCIYKNSLFVVGKFGMARAEIKGKNSFSPFTIIPNRSLQYYKRVDKFVIDKDGLMLMKTDKGIFSLQVDSLFDGRAPVSQNNFFQLVLQQPEEKGISPGDTFRFSQGYEKIELTSINYYGAGNPRYIYRIAGRSDWEESVSGELFIGTLEPGEYYQVECKQRDDIWEGTPTVFYIYRYPYWWQTQTWRTIFWVSGILGFILLVLTTILITRYFVARKNARRRMLTDLELRAIHSQINPHFIFNTLSTALFFINKKRFDDAYTHVNRFSQLLRSYLKSSQDRYTILDEEIKMLRNYVELQQIRFENKFAYTIEVDNKLPVANIRIPSLLLQPLVENAINHGLFHRAEGGRLVLRFLQGADSTELICIIDDNGVGRIAAREINDASSTKESYGTKLTNQLLEVFKQYENLDIKLDYTDKVAPETGTIVMLTLKNIKYVA